MEFNKFLFNILLNNKYLVLIGSSIMRSFYKDLVLLSQQDRILTYSEMKLKGENTFLNDKLLEGGKQHNGTSYKEVREYQNEHFLLRYYFVTRSYNEYVECILTDMYLNESPDIVLFNSTLWDLSRYSSNPLPDYRINIEKICLVFKKILKPSCLVIFPTTLPISTHCQGAFLSENALCIKEYLRFDILRANFYAQDIFVRNGFDVIDFHHKFKYHIEERASDGTHWSNIAHRIMTYDFLNHIVRVWKVEQQLKKIQLEHRHDSILNLNDLKVLNGKKSEKFATSNNQTQLLAKNTLKRKNNEELIINKKNSFKIYEDNDAIVDSVSANEKSFLDDNVTNKINDCSTLTQCKIMNDIAPKKKFGDELDIINPIVKKSNQIINENKTKNKYKIINKYNKNIRFQNYRNNIPKLGNLDFKNYNNFRSNNCKHNGSLFKEHFEINNYPYNRGFHGNMSTSHLNNLIYNNGPDNEYYNENYFSTSHINNYFYRNGPDNGYINNMSHLNEYNYDYLNKSNNEYSGIHLNKFMQDIGGNLRDNNIKDLFNQNELENVNYEYNVLYNRDNSGIFNCGPGRRWPINGFKQDLCSNYVNLGNHNDENADYEFRNEFNNVNNLFNNYNDVDYRLNNHSRRAEYNFEVNDISNFYNFSNNCNLVGNQLRNLTNKFLDFNNSRKDY